MRPRRRDSRTTWGIHLLATSLKKNLTSWFEARAYRTATKEMPKLFG